MSHYVYLPMAESKMAAVNFRHQLVLQTSCWCILMDASRKLHAQAVCGLQLAHVKAGCS